MKIARSDTRNTGKAIVGGNVRFDRAIFSGSSKIEITQRSEPHDAWDKATALSEKLIWPITIGAILFAFRKPLKRFVEEIGNRGGEISIGAIGIKLPVAEKASISGDDLLFFKTADPTTIANDSAKTTLLKMLRDPSPREYVVINLGTGKEWLSSRLFIFALMLQRMKAIHCVVFLEGSVPKFLAAATPDAIRWSIAETQPWLERAYANAYVSSIPIYMPGDSFVRSRCGAVDPEVADTLIRNYIQLICLPGSEIPPVGDESEWVTLKNAMEHGSWLSGKHVQNIIGEALCTDVIQESNDRGNEARALLQCTAPYVARLKSTGEFLSLVDRSKFVNELTFRLMARLDWLRGSTTGEHKVP